MREAADRGDEKLTTFCSRKTWRSVENALSRRRDEVSVYYVPRGRDRVLYAAILEGLLLHPDHDDDQTEAFLATQLDSHRDSEDGLWEEYGGVQTLYRVRQFSPVKEPFPFTDLRKVSDGQPIDPDYGYSYSLVHERT